MGGVAEIGKYDMLKYFGRGVLLIFFPGIICVKYFSFYLVIRLKYKLPHSVRKLKFGAKLPTPVFQFQTLLINNSDTKIESQCGKLDLLCE